MKALIKKYPTNARYESENEVWEEPRWTPAMKESGKLEPYINEDYGYALCEDCPEDYLSYLPEEGNTDPTTLFEVTEHSKEVPSDYPEEPTQVVRYWTAKFIGE